MMMIQAAEAEARRFLWGWAASPGPQGVGRVVLAGAAAAIPASRPLEAVCIHLDATRGMVHLGAGAETARDRLPWSGNGRLP